MPYFINTWKSPKPGHFMEVAKATQEALQGSGKPGNVSTTISHPRPTERNMGVVVTIAGFPEITDVEEFFDAMLGDESRFASVEKANALCDHFNVSVSEVLHGPNTLPDNFSPKFIQRLFITPRLDKLRELLSLVPDMRETSVRSNIVVSRPLSGPSASIRVSCFVESLESLKELNSQFIGSPIQKTIQQSVASPTVRGLARIFYVNSVS